MAELNGTNGKNGNRLGFVALSLFGPPVLGLAIGWVTTLNSRLVTHTERIAVIDAQLQDARAQLQSINAKIDKLLDRRP